MDTRHVHDNVEQSNDRSNTQASCQDAIVECDKDTPQRKSGPVACSMAQRVYIDGAIPKVRLLPLFRKDLARSKLRGGSAIFALCSSAFSVGLYNFLPIMRPSLMQNSPCSVNHPIHRVLHLAQGMSHRIVRISMMVLHEHMINCHTD